MRHVTVFLLLSTAATVAGCGGGSTSRIDGAADGSVADRAGELGSETGADSAGEAAAGADAASEEAAADGAPDTDGARPEAGAEAGGGEAGPAAPITVALDPTLLPAGAILPDADADQPRPLAALTDASGIPLLFVEDEVLVITSEQAVVDSVAARLRGTVVRTFDPGAYGFPNLARRNLLRVDTSATDGSALVADLGRLNPARRGQLRVSSAAGLRLLAAVAREAADGAAVTMNAVARGASIETGSTAEGSNAVAGSVGGVSYQPDAWQWTYMRVGGAQDVGVTKAWQDLKTANLLSAKVKIAVIDGGFKNGGDFPASVEHHTNSVHPVSPALPNELTCSGGASCPWHGTNVVDTAMGVVDNAAGAAGPAGPVAEAVTVRLSGDVFNYEAAVYVAAFSHASIINMSYGARYPALLAFNALPLAASTAVLAGAGVTLIAAAGNDDADVDSEDCFGLCYEDAWFSPCENDGVLCVGALADGSKMRHPDSNWGHQSVDMFGPGRVWVGPDDGAPQIHPFEGTSAAAPFVAGVAALMKAGRPSLTPDDIRKVLIQTSNSSPDDTVKSYVKAGAAVHGAIDFGNLGPGPFTARWHSILSGRGDDPCVWTVGCDKGVPAPTDDVIITAGTTVSGLAGGTVNVQEGAGLDGGSTLGNLSIGTPLTTGTGTVTLRNITVGGDLLVYAPIDVSGYLFLGGGLSNYSRIVMPNGPGSAVTFGDYHAGTTDNPNVIANHGEIVAPPTGELTDVTLKKKTRGPNLYQLLGKGTWSGVRGMIVATGAVLRPIAVETTLSMQAFELQADAILDLNGGRLRLQTESVFNAGSIRIDGAGAVMDVAGRGAARATFENYGAITGAGEVVFAPDGEMLLTSAADPPSVWTARLRVAAGNVQAQLRLDAPILVDHGATLTLRGGIQHVTRDLTVNGTLAGPADSPLCFDGAGARFTNDGVVSASSVAFGCPGAAATSIEQTVAGHGIFSGAALSVGGGAAAQTTLKLADDTQALITGQLQVNRGSRLALETHTFHFSGATFLNDGAVAGPGTVRAFNSSGATTFLSTIAPRPAFAADLKVDSGHVIAGDQTLRFSLEGDLTVEAAATLTVGPSGLLAAGNVTNGGLMDTTGGGPITFEGMRLVNTGAITGARLAIGRLGAPTQHTLAGAGAWIGPGGQLEILASSTVTLAGDVTYADSQLFLDGTIDAATHTLTLPCGLQWSGNGDVLGTSRRTATALCPAEIQLGNAASTVRFPAGAAPTAVAVTLRRAAPADFASAVTRSYAIAPTPDAGTAATLRLHYLDAELNANAEAALQLFRQPAGGGAWTAQGATSRSGAANWVEVAGVAATGTWTAAAAGP